MFRNVFLKFVVLFILSSLYKTLHPNDDKIELDKFHDTHKISEHLKGLPPNRRKTILSALVVISD